MQNSQKFLDRLGQNVAILGTQWGDEGKGKLVDVIAGNFDYVCRSVGGANAGHTIVVDGEKYVFHLLPSGLLHDGTVAVIGNGTVLSPQSIMTELDKLEAAGIKTEGRVWIARNTHIICEYHKLIDAELEKRKGKNKIGTTCRGIGPCYTDKVARIGIRAEDLLDKDLLKEKLQRNAELLSSMYDIEIDWKFELAQIEPYIARMIPMIRDVPMDLTEEIAKGKRALYEGAQAHNLDVDHGTYPYVTSSSISLGGTATGLGVPPNTINTVIGIAKAYTSRVGAGPFPSELLDERGEGIRDRGHEYGSTTGRPRRCGWFDAVAVRRSVVINGVDELNLTKLDVLTGMDELEIVDAYVLDGQEIAYMPTNPKDIERMEIKTVTMPGWKEDITSMTDYDSLPQAAKDYIDAITEVCGCPVTSVGTGPGRKDLVYVDPA